MLPCRLPPDRAMVMMPHKELYSENQDLVEWSDGVFEKHFTQ
jgi:hypothetical protein